MKRIFLSLALVVAACLNAAAQTNLIASLSHNDKLTAYYGEEALKEAYAAAQDGDVITLSSGTFNCPDTIRKAISLKGAGMANHGQTPSTMVKGDIVLIGQQGKKQMAVEGIHFMGIAKASGNGLKDEVTFLKCRLKAMAYNVFAKYISCLLQGGVDLGNQYYVTPTQAYCTNCIINSSILGSEPERSITIDHCVAKCYTFTDRLTAMNSVIIYSGNYGNPESNFSHCVGVSTSQDADYFEFCPDGDNLMIYGYENLFKFNSNGYLTYDDKTYTCRVGVDVSKYQGTIDWAKVKASGVDFAILRLGYRGYGTGALALDSTFYTNLKNAQAAGVQVGVYFFSQAITPAEAVEEADFCVNALKGYQITYPIVYDWEPYAESVGARTNGLDGATLTACTKAFLDRVKAWGYTPMVYSNPTYFYLHLDMNQLTGYQIWLAHYVSMTNFYYQYNIWQYAYSGSVPGISGNVDLNIQLVKK